MVTENWIILVVICISWAVNYVQTASCIMTGNWFDNMTTESERLTNFIENSKMRYEDPEIYDEDCKENRIRLSVIRRNQINIACYVILESLILFLFVNPLEFKAKEYTFFRERGWEWTLKNDQIVLGLGGMHAFFLWRTKGEEIWNYFRRKLSMLIRYNPKNETDVGIYNSTSDILYRSSVKMVLRTLLKLWIPF
jgi:hypothetical protein